MKLNICFKLFLINGLLICEVNVNGMFTFAVRYFGNLVYGDVIGNYMKAKNIKGAKTEFARYCIKINEKKDHVDIDSENYKIVNNIINLQFLKDFLNYPSPEEERSALVFKIEKNLACEKNKELVHFLRKDYFDLIDLVFYYRNRFRPWYEKLFGIYGSYLKPTICMDIEWVKSHYGENFFNDFKISINEYIDNIIASEQEYLDSLLTKTKFPRVYEACEKYLAIK